MKCFDHSGVTRPSQPVFDAEILMRVAAPEGPSLLPLSPLHVFHTGDRFRLRVTAPFTGFVYVVSLGSRDEIRVLYPLNDQANMSDVFMKCPSAVVPDRAWFRFDNAPGAEDVYVIWSREPLDRLEAASDGARLEMDDILDLQHLAEEGQRPGAPSVLVVHRIRLFHVENSPENVLR